MKRSVLALAVIALWFALAAGCNEGHDTYYDGSRPHSTGTVPYTPPPPPPPIPPPGPSYDRLDVTLVVAALAYDMDTDDILGDIEIEYSVDYGPYYSLGWTEFYPYYTPSYGPFPDEIVNFGDPDAGPEIYIGDIYEDEVVYVTIRADDPIYDEYYTRFVDLEIYNDPDGLTIYADGAEISIDMTEADYIDPILPLIVDFDMAWIYY